MKKGFYPYCDNCPIVFPSIAEENNCSLHWRPQTGTKEGFPVDGKLNCPRDYKAVKDAIEHGKKVGYDGMYSMWIIEEGE